MDHLDYICDIALHRNRPPATYRSPFSSFPLSQESGPDQSVHKQPANQISRDSSSVLRLLASQAHLRTWRWAFYVRRPPPLVCSGFLYLEGCGERPSWSPLWVFRVMYLITAGFIALACKRTARSGADSKVDHVSRRQRLSRGRSEDCGRLGMPWSALAGGCWCCEVE
jgi:hypothetical protein